MHASLAMNNRVFLLLLHCSVSWISCAYCLRPSDHVDARQPDTSFVNQGQDDCGTLLTINMAWWCWHKPMRLQDLSVYLLLLLR